MSAPILAQLYSAGGYPPQVAGPPQHHQGQYGTAPTGPNFEKSHLIRFATICDERPLVTMTSVAGRKSAGETWFATHIQAGHYTSGGARSGMLNLHYIIRATG